MTIISIKFRNERKKQLYCQQTMSHYTSLNQHFLHGAFFWVPMRVDLRDTHDNCLQQLLLQTQAEIQEFRTFPTKAHSELACSSKKKNHSGAIPSTHYRHVTVKLHSMWRRTTIYENHSHDTLTPITNTFDSSNPALYKKSLKLGTLSVGPYINR